MPTYEYRCTACEHAFEQFHSMKDKPIRKCPKCGRNAVERLIGRGAGVIFKGSGFYETDYRSDAYKKSAAADTKSSGGGDKPGESSGGGGASGGGGGGSCACGKKPASECGGSKESKPADSPKSAKK